MRHHIELKKCTKCNTEKNITEFSKNKRSKDHLQNECKSCAKERRDIIISKNPDYYNKAIKEHFLRKPKPIIINNKRIPFEKGTPEYSDERSRRRKEYEKKYKSTEKGLSAIRRSNNKNSLRKKALRVSLRENNPEQYALLLKKGREKNKFYYANNKDKSLAVYHTRRAKIFGNGGSYTKEDISNLYLTQKGKCVVCFCSIKRKKHIDHIIPLSKGGTSDKYNLQLLCPACNIRKGGKDPVDFMQSQGFLL